MKVRDNLQTRVWCPKWKSRILVDRWDFQVSFQCDCSHWNSAAQRKMAPNPPRSNKTLSTVIRNDTFAKNSLTENRSLIMEKLISSNVNINLSNLKHSKQAEVLGSNLIFFQLYEKKTRWYELDTFEKSFILFWTWSGSRLGSMLHQLFNKWVIWTSQGN